MFGVIGGTGFQDLPEVRVEDKVWFDTPFGEASGPISICACGDSRFAFLARHGSPHTIPPHLINYRANLFALKKAGVKQIVAVNAVGGIHNELAPGDISIPDQIIDYTYGREHTIYDGVYVEAVDHIDFTNPYTETLRKKIIEASLNTNVRLLSGGVYGATQGPRLESAAEIRRLKNDGCDMVGMTGMPEASLARELNLDYACIAMSANWAAGLSDNEITMREIELSIVEASVKVNKILLHLLGEQ